MIIRLYDYPFCTRRSLWRLLATKARALAPPEKFPLSLIDFLLACMAELNPTKNICHLPQEQGAHENKEENFFSVGPKLFVNPTLAPRNYCFPTDACKCLKASGKEMQRILLNWIEFISRVKGILLQSRIHSFGTEATIALWITWLIRCIRARSRPGWNKLEQTIGSYAG